ncbi:ethanolamine ammonia-lyase reactivating factor EutA [Marivita sp.]|uniref:ethanolamine ammonia-lyase reactivating factor EutA n=1 Tax=Marivita sp. TaxID=2003365 RepID=UPI003F7095F9
MLSIPEETDPGGRVFFSGADRSLVEEDEIQLVSVGIDIGSSTSHLLFSRITLERMDTRYIVAAREVLHASDILFTPYVQGEDIDADALGDFIDDAYEAAGIGRGDIDTGALILTGVASRRRNARAIGEVLSAEAGKFVALSAGDSLETLMAAHGSGARALSEEGGPVLNVDVGGGTTKVALCDGGEIVARTALDVGARLLAFDDTGRITRLEPFGARHLSDAGLTVGKGEILGVADRAHLAGVMADRIITVLAGGTAEGLMRLPGLPNAPLAPRIVVSGGVSEYLEAGTPGDDLGFELARALDSRIAAQGWPRIAARQGIRATVVGASQYTVQVSGSTIFLDPPGILPLRNLAVIAPDLPLDDEIDADACAKAVRDALARLDLSGQPVAVAVPWQGSASYARLAALARGLVKGLRDTLKAGHPLVLVCDGDIGGLLGMQARSEEHVPAAIISIDGIRLSEFDFIDIGDVIRATGAAPVVIKSLLFPTE